MAGENENDVNDQAGNPQEQPGGSQDQRDRQGQGNRRNREDQDRNRNRGQNRNRRENRDSEDDGDDDENNARNDDSAVSEQEIAGKKLEELRTKGEVKAFVKRFKKLTNDPNFDPLEGKSFDELQKEYLDVMRWEKDEKVDFGKYRNFLVTKIRDRFGEQGQEFFLKAAEYSKKREEIKEGKKSSFEMSKEETMGMPSIVEAAIRDKKLREAQDRVGRTLTSEEAEEALTLSADDKAKIDAGDMPEADYLKPETKQKVKTEQKRLGEKKGVAEQIMERIERELRSSKKSLPELQTELKNTKVGIGSMLHSLMALELEAKKDEAHAEIESLVDRAGSLSDLQRAIIGRADEAVDENNQYDGLLGRVRRRRAEKRQDFYRVPSSIQELAALIMDREAEFSLYKEAGGEHPLIDETGFRKDNFMLWIRKSAMYWHGFSPDDKIDLFNQVSIYTGQRQYSFGEMYKNDNYFTDNETGTVLKDFREKCMHELWLFTMSHNMDAQYRVAMGSDEQLPKTIQQLYFNNTFTKNSSGKSTFEWILNMPSYHFEGEGEQKQLKESTQTGQALRRALLTYYYLTDFDMLQKIYKDNPVSLFKKRHLVYNDHKLLAKESDKNYEIKTKKDPETDEERQILYEIVEDADGKHEVEVGKIPPGAKEERTTIIDPATGQKKEVIAFTVEGKGGASHSGADDNLWDPDGKWFDEQGNFIDDPKGKNRKEFILYTNIWNDVQRDLSSVGIIRERVKQSIMAETGISHQDADYVENWAHTMARWSGMAAKNDDGAVGFDAWTKVQNFADYRMRQIESRRGGMAGNYYNIDIIKRIGVDFFDGAITTDGRSIKELIQGSKEAGVVNIKPDDIKGIAFRDNTMNKFADDHLIRCFGILNKLSEGGEFNFEQAVTWDPRNLQYSIDQKKVNEIVDGLQKELRNAYSTFKQMDFSKKVRYYEKAYKPDPVKRGHEVDKVEFKETSIAEMLFGDVVTDAIVEKFETEDLPRDREIRRKRVREGEMTIAEYREWEAKIEKMKDKNGKWDKGKLYDYDRNYNWREVMKGIVETEMIAHYNSRSPYKQFTMGEVEKYWSALQNIPGGIEIDHKDPTKIRITKGLFTGGEINKMRKKSKTGFWRILLSETVLAAIMGLGVGVAKGTKEAGEATLKSAA